VTLVVAVAVVENSVVDEDVVTVVTVVSSVVAEAAEIVAIAVNVPSVANVVIIVADEVVIAVIIVAGEVVSAVNIVEEDADAEIAEENIMVVGVAAAATVLLFLSMMSLLSLAWVESRDVPHHARIPTPQHITPTTTISFYNNFLPPILYDVKGNTRRLDNVILLYWRSWRQRAKHL